MSDVTRVQDWIIDRLQGPAEFVEAVTGRSFQLVTAALYAVAALLPFMSVAAFGGTPVGICLLPLYVGFCLWRMRGALALAASAPRAALSAERVAPHLVLFRMVWTAVTAVALAGMGLSLATGHHPRGPFLLAPVVAMFLALHLHACRPPSGGFRRHGVAPAPAA